ncbi:MAG: hypothetical protein H6709_10220 [Kofleriaceae bacterium]|nr:hypothetical protein [Myxococcales bacterium]MCB9564036.1 hypothetical protein [Kofleriaceae bacterium]MCB9572450.1 hypothetical protein [Kofleriaceae bacterium]
MWKGRAESVARWDSCIYEHLFADLGDQLLRGCPVAAPGEAAPLQHALDGAMALIGHRMGRATGCVRGPCASYTPGLVPVMLSIYVLRCPSQAAIYRGVLGRCGAVSYRWSERQDGATGGVASEKPSGTKDIDE